MDPNNRGVRTERTQHTDRQKHEKTQTQVTMDIIIIVVLQAEQTATTTKDDNIPFDTQQQETTPITSIDVNSMLHTARCR
jgi:hypothetical protein